LDTDMTAWHKTGLSFTEDDAFHRLVVNNTGGLVVSYDVNDLGSDLTPHNWCWTGQLFLTSSGKVQLTV